MMMRVPLVLILAATWAGCAALPGRRGPSAESELARGVAAIRSQNYTSAREILEPVYRAHYMDRAGQQALLLLTITDLDPRNPTRRLYAASDYASSLLNIKDTPEWERGVAETLYLLSQELGAHEEELERAEAARQQAQQTVASMQRELPRSSRESWPAQIKKIRDERDVMAKKVDQLQASLRSKDKELTDVTQELERIKKTLKIR